MSDERGDLTPQEMDELASAYLDGEATLEEAALVESDPRMQALVEELRVVRDLLAAPVEVPSDEVRDEMIARALDHRAPVVSLETARRRLRAIPPQARVILAAAAVIAAIAVVGVTIFERQGDEFAGDDDAGPASVAADAPAMEMMESAPASEEESAVAADEVPMDDSEDSAEVFASEAPAEQAGEEEMAVQLSEAPMDDSEQPAEDQGEPEPMMADEPEPLSAPEEAPLVFETAAELADYALVLTEELIYVRETERPDDATEVDLLGCPLIPDEDLELLVRFDALVDGVEVQASVYVTETELQLTETTPPPECELINSRTFLHRRE